MELASTFLLLLAAATSLHIAANACDYHGDGPKFGYTGAIGPAMWGSLSPNYSACSHDWRQSPVDIVRKKAAVVVIGSDPPPPIRYAYADSADADFLNNGYNIELKFVEDAGWIVVEGKKYSLDNAHWHTPSEHTFDGIRYDMELHLVHKSVDGGIAVRAVLYKYGRADPFLSQVGKGLKRLRVVSDGQVKEEVTAGRVRLSRLDVTRTCPSPPPYYRYLGSLTAPPCTPNVIWSIDPKVREVSKNQVNDLHAPLVVEYQRNARPLQPLNGRTIELYRPQYPTPFPH